MFARKGASQGKRTSSAMRQVFGEGNNSTGLRPGGWEHMAGDGTCAGRTPHCERPRVLHKPLRGGKAPGLG